MATPQILISETRPEHCAALGDLQRLVFPTLTDDELFTAAKYQKHLELFPEGQFVALAIVAGREIPVGATSTYRTHFDFDHIEGHSFVEAIANGWLTNHVPDGDWLYGADVSVHPDYRRLGIASRLYDARRALVKRLNLRGEIAGGMLPGYDSYRAQYTIDQYVKAVARGEVKDPTLTAQLRNGFEARAVLYNYITDPRSDNHATLIVRANPEYQPPR
ncbi:MAG: GNAT family N-acetyltransferase [Chloroflexi bacterium]|nr:GNAT family N-acetyltransferase [Chloroflexota bacterium]